MATAIKKFMAAKKANALELAIYGEIGENWMGDGITPQSVSDAIKSAGKIDSITVRLNSPGGSSFDGVAIHNILRQQGVPVNVIVEGMAASAAFTIAMAGDSIQVCDGAMMMLHCAWSIALGDATEMRKTADLLDAVSGTLRDLYAKRSGISADDVWSLMTAETWMTGSEAVQHGFATAKLDTTPTKEAAALAASFDLSKFCAKVPESLKPRAAEGEGMEMTPNENGCECQCSECQENNCPDCSNVGCTDKNCEHEDVETGENRVTAEPNAEAARAAMRMRLRLAEVTAPIQ